MTFERHKGEICDIHDSLITGKYSFLSFSRTEVSAFIFVTFYSQIIIRPDSIF